MGWSHDIVGGAIVQLSPLIHAEVSICPSFFALESLRVSKLQDNGRASE